MKRCLATFLVLLGGCAFDPGGGASEPDDSDDVNVTDPAVTVVGGADVGSGPSTSSALPLNATCSQTGAPCDEGLTCRPRLAGPGVCRPTGEGDIGDACEPEGDTCAAELACAVESPALGGRCVAVCVVTASHCSADQACVPWWDTGVGFCR